MLRHIFLTFLVSFVLWHSTLYAQDVGLFFAVDCTTEITAPVANRTLCMQSGGTAGLYLYTGSWTLIVAAGGEAPSTADYFVGTADSGLSAERVGTDTATIDVDIGTAAQARFNVIMSATYTWTGSHSFTGGRILIPGVVYANLPGSPATNTIAIVTDCLNASCSAGGGSTIRLVRYDGANWVILGDGSSEADTLDTVFDRGKTIDGANSAANAVQIGSATRWCIYHDATKGLRMLPCTASNTQTVVMTNFVWQLFDEEGDAAIMTADPDAIGAGSGTVTMATSQQLVASNLGVEFTESDTNPACAAGNYNIYADTSETKLKKCQNGTASDLAPALTSSHPYSFTCDSLDLVGAGGWLWPGTSLETACNGSDVVANQVMATRTGTLQRLHCFVSTAPGAGTSWAFTAQLNGSDSAQTCTIANTATTCNDTSNTPATTAGQRIGIKIVESGAAAASTGVCGIENVF